MHTFEGMKRRGQQQYLVFDGCGVSTEGGGGISHAGSLLCVCVPVNFPKFSPKGCQVCELRQLSAGTTFAIVNRLYHVPPPTPACTYIQASHAACESHGSMCSPLCEQHISNSSPSLSPPHPFGHSINLGNIVALPTRHNMI